MCYEIIRVRTEYLKGYYNFTDLINGLSLIILASILIFIAEILISYFSDWKSTSSHMKKGWQFFLYFEMMLGIITLIFYSMVENFNINYSHYSEPFLQSLVSFSDCANGIVLIVASIVSQLILKKRKITENQHK